MGWFSLNCISQYVVEFFNLISGAIFVSEYTAITVLLGSPANSATRILTLFTFLVFESNNNPTPHCEAYALFLHANDVIRW